jgi:hypothetical protein
MRVQRVLMPDGAESWTVLDAGGDPVPAVESFLSHLQALDRSPATVRTYATSLKLWLQFLDGLGVGVDQVTVEHVSRFVAWLRAPADNVTVLAGGSGRCGPATVNKHLAALFSAEFLPVHRQQAELTRELLDAAEAAGRQRQAQNHRTVLVNLDKIIASLQALRRPGADENA